MAGREVVEGSRTALFRPGLVAMNVLELIHMHTYVHTYVRSLSLYHSNTLRSKPS